MYWLFNSDKFDFDGRAMENLSWEQSRNFFGKEGDTIIFYSFKKDTELFTHVYSIGSKKSTIIGKNRQEKDILNIELKLILEKNYKEGKKLDDYIYSIPRIKSFDKFLYRHFNRKYYRLSKIEFNAIDNDKIFESRTILGTALNALHIDHKKAFSIYLVEQYPEVIQNIYNYRSILNLFY